MNQTLRITAIIAALAAGLGSLAIWFAILGASPGQTLLAVGQGAFGSRLGWSETLLRWIPIALCATAAVVPARCGLINIGGEGQLIVGAIGAAVAAPFLGEFPAWIATPIAATAACVAAALWAGLGLVFRAGVPAGEALVTLFLNYIAALGLGYLVHGPLRDPGSQGWPMSPPLPKSMLLPPVFEGRLHAGLYAAAAATGVVLLALSFTRRGKELEIIGQTPDLSRDIGIPVRRFWAGAMILGGALAGLGGYFEVSGVQHKLRPEIALGFGYSGFLVAWMSREHLGMLPVFSLIVAGLITGAESLQMSSGLPSATADIFQASLLLMLLLAQAIEVWLRNRQAARGALRGPA